MNVVRRSLARRMVVLILLGAGLVLALVLGYSHVSQRLRLLADAMRHGDALAQSAAYQIEARLAPAEAVVRQVALEFSGGEMHRAECTRLIRRTLENNPDLKGMAIALSQETAAREDFQILYGWRQQQSLQVRDRERPDLDYRHEWFLLPCQLGRPVWIEPYYDPDARVLMVTYSVPIRRDGQVVAVVTCDLSLEWIRQLLDALPLGEGGIAVLLSQRGTYVSHPQRELEMKATIFSLADTVADPKRRQGLHELGREMLSGRPGHRYYHRPLDNQPAYIHYCRVPATGWALGVIFPKDRVLAPLVRLNHLSALVGLGGLALLLIPALGIAWTVARPLRQLADSARRLAGGDFEAPLPAVRTGDEVAQLAEAFDHMRRELRQYIADLTSTTAVKERLAGELSAAREIQMGIVPKLFPPFPNRSDLDLHAMLIPAREVGGDLYDFLLLDDRHLYLAIGDVSGKGVPASLLMAVGKTLLKSTVQAVRAPARALAQVNGELAEHNESCMFISLFCGVLNLATGDLIYANAGHNPPFLLRRSGALERLDEPPGPVLGALPGRMYHDRHLRLEPGDLLLLYTDGVTEALTPAGALFGEERLAEHLRREGDREARRLLDGLAQALHDYSAGVEQSDDITALAVRYLGSRTAASDPTPPPVDGTDRPPDAVLRLPNRTAELGRLAAWLDTQARALAIPPAVRTDLGLALEEWLANVIAYAHDDGAEHSMEVRLWRDPAEVRVEIEDDGQPFDPTVQAAVDISLPPEHRPIGGLGIHFIRQTADRFAYRRTGGHNIVTIVKILTDPPPTSTKGHTHGEC